MNITIRLKDGTVREFKHEGRAGGSYTKHLSYEPGFVIVTDEWDKQTAFPTADVAEIISIPRGRCW